MAASDFQNVTPGFPALNPQTAVTTSEASGGAYEVPSSSFNGTVKVTPLKTFSWMLPGGGQSTFYKGMARAVPQDVHDQMVTAGLVS